MALDLASRQHGVVCRQQLLAGGVSGDVVKGWLRVGRLHRVHAGAYAVGRPQIGRLGAWAAALLACPPDAALSHRSAGALWGLCAAGPRIEITVPRSTMVRRPGIRVYRRAATPADDVAIERGLRVTTPARTLIDLALHFAREPLESAINEAGRRDLIDPDHLRDVVESRAPAPGVVRLRGLLDRRTFQLTDSQLERRFLPIAQRAGLPRPLTRQLVNGYRVDFYWPQLGLVIETDGLRYHRTPERQSRDARRDQARAAAGLTSLRFTHEQVRYHPAEVASILREVAAVLGAV